MKKTTQRIFYLLLGFVPIGVTAQTWQTIPLGKGASISDASCPDANTCYTVGINGKIYKTTDAGATWFDLNNPNTVHLSAVSCPNGSTCFALGQNGTVLRTTTSGQSWESSQSPVSGSGIYFFNSTTGFITGGAANSLAKTTDGGDFWQVIQTNYDGVIQQMQFFSESNGVALGKEYDQNTQTSYATVLKTTDGGTTWNVLSKIANVQFTDFHFPTELYGYISANNGKVFKSTNGGQTWTENNLGISEPFHAVHFTDNYIGFVAGALGKMYKTVNGGASWTALDTGGKFQFIELHFFDANKGLFFVGGNSVVRTTTGGN